MALRMVRVEFGAASSEREARSRLSSVDDGWALSCDAALTAFFDPSGRPRRRVNGVFPNGDWLSVILLFC